MSGFTFFLTPVITLVFITFLFTASYTAKRWPWHTC